MAKLRKELEGEERRAADTRREVVQGEENSPGPTSACQRERYGIQGLVVQLTLTPDMLEDRRPVDPPPIVQLRIRDPEDPGWEGRGERGEENSRPRGSVLYSAPSACQRS